MDDKRKNLKKHISAAKAWLGKAEHSLDNDNDIKSELNIMLAKAELQRADETSTKPRFRKILLNIAPFAAASTAAFLIWNFSLNRPDDNIVDSIPNTNNIVVSANKPPSATPSKPNHDATDNYRLFHDTPSSGTSMPNVITGSDTFHTTADESTTMPTGTNESDTTEQSKKVTEDPIATQFADERYYAETEDSPDDTPDNNDTYVLYTTPAVNNDTHAVSVPNDDIEQLMQSAYFNLRKE